jgi:hypothetical protein
MEYSVTSAMTLTMKYTSASECFLVCHSVGPIYSLQSPDESEQLLASAYRSSLRLARAQGLKTIAFPAISNGVYGYPLEEAAEVGGVRRVSVACTLAKVRARMLTHISSFMQIAVRTCSEESHGLDEVRFVLFSDVAMSAFKAAADGAFDLVQGDGEL